MRILTYNQEDAKIAEACFEQIKLSMGMHFDPEALEVKSVRDYMMDRVSTVFTMKLLARNLNPDTIETVEVPLTWFDHLKSRLGLKHRTRKIETVTRHYEVYYSRKDAMEATNEPS